MHAASVMHPIALLQSLANVLRKDLYQKGNLSCHQPRIVFFK